MHLCVPVTDIFRRNQERILPLVGAVSFKEPGDEVFHGKERMLECSLSIGSPVFQEDMVKTGLMAALKSGLYSSFACDLGPPWIEVNDSGRSPNGYPRYLPGAGSMTEEEYVKQAQFNVGFLRSNFPGRIKVENLNYFPTGAYETVCDPDFIARVVRRLGIELLLDVGHTVISVHNLGFDSRDYLTRLPLETVSEVQLSGSNFLNNVLEDTHELPSDSDLDLLSTVLDSAPVEYVTLEYYKDDEKLVSGYQRLHALVNSSS